MKSKVSVLMLWLSCLFGTLRGSSNSAIENLADIASWSAYDFAFAKSLFEGRGKGFESRRDSLCVVLVVLVVTTVFPVSSTMS